MHPQCHPLKNKIVILNIHTVPDRNVVKPGVAFKVLDWFDRKKERAAPLETEFIESIIARHYSARASTLPDDEEIVIGYIGEYIVIVHESEIGGIWE